MLIDELTGKPEAEAEAVGPGEAVGGAWMAFEATYKDGQRGML